MFCTKKDERPTLIHGVGSACASFIVSNAVLPSAGYYMYTPRYRLDETETRGCSFLPRFLAVLILVRSGIP